MNKKQFKNAEDFEKALEQLNFNQSPSEMHCVSQHCEEIKDDSKDYR
jgi:hypothetical protein